MTAGKAYFSILFLVHVLFAIGTVSVFAQSSDSLSTTSTSSNQEVTTETLSDNSLESQASELWYETEGISGNIDVGDFVVGPGKAEITVAPGQTVVQYVTLTNRISDDREFKIEVEDITGSTDGSSAVSLTGDARGPYSLRDYISFPEDTVRLKLGERVRLPITVTVPPDASPGGYYGSILISTIQRAVGDTTAQVPQSPIIARVGSLFFVTVPGDIEYSGRVMSIDTVGDDWWYETGPINFTIAAENTGSIHLNPYGELSITNMIGEEVGFIMLEPWFVLPRSIRSREVDWDRAFLFGRYTATAKINRGYDDIVDEVSVSFWVLPWKVVGLVFLILFVVFFSIRAFFRTFEFKRRA